jgi:hypothetical protein
MLSRLRSGGQDLLAADDPTCLLAFWRGGQDLTPVCCDKDVVFDPHAADGVVLLEKGGVDVFRVPRGFEVDLLEGVVGEVASFERLVS